MTSAATNFGTTIRHASKTSSSISRRDSLSSRATTQLKRMSDWRGYVNFSG
jgi:hypothetical protein